MEVARAPNQHILFTGERGHELARNIIDALFVFVGVLAKDGTVLEANAAPLKAARVSLSQVRGKQLWNSYWWNYSREVQAQVQSACELAARGETTRFDTFVRMTDDRRVPIDFQLAPLRSPSGQVSHLVASAVDITRRKNAEDELHERDRRKDAFIAALAHELRNPLAPIPNALEILARLSSADERAVRARAVIGRQVTHLGGLVDDLLDIARIGRGDMPLNMLVCDLCAIAAQTAEDYRDALEGAGCTLHINAARDRPMVRADPVRVGQMVRNFLQNAQRYAAGKSVTLKCHQDALRRLACVSVCDTGQGFTPQSAAKLFELGQAEEDITRVPAGMGLGLSLTKGLAQLQGGSVSARSDGVGKGATFEFCLPLVADLPMPTAPDVPPLEIRSGHRVLIVEDHMDTAETLRILLEAQGYEVFVAFDATAGVALAQVWRPDIVISDIGLPGMTGYELAATLRRRPTCAHALLVAVSGYADEDARRRSKAAGFDMHLAKPVSPSELLKVLERALASD